MYRKIIFIQANEKAWGFPLPHLLGMCLSRNTSGSGESPDTLTLYFTAETVEVTGNSLPALCGKLMVGKPDAEDGGVRIQTGKHTYEGQPYSISRIISAPEC